MLTILKIVAGVVAISEATPQNVAVASHLASSARSLSRSGKVDDDE